MLLAACTASAPRSTPSGAGNPQADVLAASSRPRSSRDVLSEEEIKASTGGNVYDLVQKLRPAWLRQKGDPSQMDADGSREIRVWVNGRDAGGLSILRDYDSHQIISIRWVDTINARATYGRGYGRGVIAVHTR
ncbi:MAG TPA: hypothetical protein VK420_00540 [Longimicrobium sp.]|jgi:hypothetical protein|nr:hypothetical protein [Longimicrobium sp.]